MTHRGKWLFSLLAALVLSGSSACAMLIKPGLPAPRDFAQEQPQATAPDPFQAPGQDLPPDQFPDLQPPPLVFVPASCVIADTPPQPGDILLAPDALGRMWFLRVEYEEVHNGEIRYALSPLGLCGQNGPNNSNYNYWDRYWEHVNAYALNPGPAAWALLGGLWPKSWSIATGGRPPALGSDNPLTSFPRSLGIPGAGSALVRTGAAGIGMATVGAGFWNVGVFVTGFGYAAFPGSNGL